MLFLVSLLINSVSREKLLNYGEISYDELVNRTQRSRIEQAGVISALGRRVNGTPEIGLAGPPQKITSIMNYRKIDGTTFLGLTDGAKAVLLEEGGVSDGLVFFDGYFLQK